MFKMELLGVTILMVLGYALGVTIARGATRRARGATRRTKHARPHRPGGDT